MTDVNAPDAADALARRLARPARPWARVAGVNTYENSEAETKAHVTRVGRSYVWAVTQFGGVLAQGVEARATDAKINADAWLDTAHEAAGVTA
jgi:hypothetical protein